MNIESFFMMPTMMMFVMMLMMIVMMMIDEKNDLRLERNGFGLPTGGDKKRDQVPVSSTLSRHRDDDDNDDGDDNDDDYDDDHDDGHFVDHDDHGDGLFDSIESLRSVQKTQGRPGVLYIV